MLVKSAFSVSAKTISIGLIAQSTQTDIGRKGFCSVKIMFLVNGLGSIKNTEAPPTTNFFFISLYL